MGEMRDIKRIKRILNLIEEYWNRNPDMRFYQMMINLGLIEDNVRIWRIEDDYLEKLLTDFMNEKRK